MRQSAVTFNAHVNYVNLSELLAEARRLNPTTLLAYIDQGGEDSANPEHPVRQLQRGLPNTRIFVRVYDQKDSGMHLRPRADGDLHMTPEAFLAKWGWLGKEGRTLQVMNEPSGYDFTPELVVWLQRLIPLAAHLGISIAAPAFAVHHPRLNAQGDQWVPAFDDLLRLLSAHRQYLSLHEYGPEFAYDARMGRFQAMLSRCAALGISAPRTQISEWGLDSLPGEPAGNGYKRRGLDGASFALYLRDQYNRYYEPYVRSGAVVGLAIFSYGDSGGWHDFNVASDRDCLDALPDLFLTEGLPSQMGYAPTVPSTLPANLRAGWAPARMVRMPGTSMNIRQAPTVESPVIGSVFLGSDLEVLDGWAAVRVGNKIGYIYLYDGRVVFE